tara:strand:- start:757 stop:936 length:180 start_codon:yes stop_codon:yes gene_type:complete
LKRVKLKRSVSRSTKPNYLEQICTTKSDTELGGVKVRGIEGIIISLVLAPTRDVKESLS